jgi:hypothetical protein
MNFIADIIHNDFKKFRACSSHRGILNATVCSKHIKYSVQKTHQFLVSGHHNLLDEYLHTMKKNPQTID